jgi:hypothetical protein
MEYILPSSDASSRHPDRPRQANALYVSPIAQLFQSLAIIVMEPFLDSASKNRQHSSLGGGLPLFDGVRDFVRASMALEKGDRLRDWLTIFAHHLNQTAKGDRRWDARNRRQ